MRYFILFLLLVAASCSTPVAPTPLLEEGTIQITPDLMKNADNYYELVLNRSDKQTIALLTAKVNSLQDGVKVAWSANSTWLLFYASDTFAVPIVNSVSYPKDNVATTVFAPVLAMLGDTVTVKAGFYQNNKTTMDSINVILK